MPNLTRSEIIEDIDWERAENNASFISPAKTIKLMDRCVKKINATEGVRTVKETVTINFTGNGEYSIPSDLKSVVGLFSGSVGSLDQVKFDYISLDEFREINYGYAYTFLNPGKIYIFATSLQSLPTASLTLDYYTKNIVLDEDGVTKKSSWTKDGDISRLPEEFDDLYVEFATAKILAREGNVANEHWNLFSNLLESLKGQGAEPKATRPRKAFGFYKGR